MTAGSPSFFHFPLLLFYRFTDIEGTYLTVKDLGTRVERFPVVRIGNTLNI